MNIWEAKPAGTLWATPGLLWDCFTCFTDQVKTVSSLMIAVRVRWPKPPISSAGMACGLIGMFTSVQCFDVSFVSSIPDQCQHKSVRKFCRAKVKFCQYTVILLFVKVLPTATQLQIPSFVVYRDANKSLAWPTSRCILFDGENISFDASLVIYINSTNIPPSIIINRIYETQNLLSLQLVSFLVGLRTYQHPCNDPP